MRRRIFLSVIAAGFFLLRGNAQQQDNLFVTAGQFQNISIADNLKVVLMQAPYNETSVKVGQEASSKLKLTLTDGNLLIAAQRNLSANTVVYILVKELHKLTVGENVLINTNGILNTDRLDVYIYGDSKAFLKTTGRVNGYAMGEFEVAVQRMPSMIN
jgi:hypothetical protein